MNQYFRFLIEQIINEEELEKTAPARKSLPRPVSNKHVFNLAELKKITDYNEVVKYLMESDLKQVSTSGGSRVVFILPNNEGVIKLARNESGIGQNKAEANSCTTPDTKDMLAKVFDKSPNYFWLLSEFAPNTTEEDFQQRTGFSTNNLDMALALSFNKIKQEDLDEQEKQSISSILKNEFFQKILNLIKACKYKPRDFAKLDSWGITRDGRLVIIDSGFTEEVAAQYYKR